MEKKHLQLSNQKLNRLQEEFGQLMAERKTWLKKANDFFNSANKVSHDQVGHFREMGQFSRRPTASMGWSTPQKWRFHEELQN